MGELRQIYEAIPGGPELLAWFGVVPSFHDAEIMRLCFCRGAPAELCVYTWNLTADIDNQGFYILGKETLVNFFLDDVVDLQLDGFTQQNVIDGLLLNLLPGAADRASAARAFPV